MNKLMCALLAVVLVGCLVLPACAESIDLTALSWEELLDLKAAITHEQLTRDEWQEVEVPQGVWVVGEDIPAGKWTIRCKTGYSTRVKWGKYLDKSQNDVDYFKDFGDAETVYNPNWDSYSHGDVTQYTFEPPEGYYIVIDFGPATFTPFTGKPDLGFKK